MDSYKSSHFKQYPPGTTHIYSYIESRGGEFDRTLFFGLQAYLKRYLSRPINVAQVDEAEEFWGRCTASPSTDRSGTIS